MPDWIPLNLKLMRNPLNWLVVFFMVLLPLIALAVVAEKFNQTPANTNTAP